MTIDMVISRARRRQGIAQPDDVLAEWIIGQEERLYDTTVKAHLGYAGDNRHAAGAAVSHADPLDLEPYHHHGFGNPRIVRKYPDDDMVHLLMDGSYSAAYIDNLFAMSAYDEGDINRYNLYSAKANDTEQAWRSRYFREHGGSAYRHTEYSNE